MTDNKNKNVFDENKIKFDFYKAGGKGGQNKNKRLTATRATYENIVVTCCDERSQGQNKQKAVEELKKRFHEKNKITTTQKNDDMRKSQDMNGGSRGSWFRNYNYWRNEIVENNKSCRLDRFMRGFIEEIR